MNIPIYAFIMITLFASLCNAETYSWQDENGLHFTDNYNTIPPKYRNKTDIREDISPPAHNSTPAKSKKKTGSSSSSSSNNYTSLEDERRSYDYNPSYTTYDQCVQYEQVNIRLEENLPIQKAYRKAILYCNNKFNVNSVQQYGRAQREINDRINR